MFSYEKIDPVLLKPLLYLLLSRGSSDNMVAALDFVLESLGSGKRGFDCVTLPLIVRLCMVEGLTYYSK